MSMPSIGLSSTLYVDALHRPIKYFICRCPPSAYQVLYMSMPSIGLSSTLYVDALHRPIKYFICRCPPSAYQVLYMSMPSIGLSSTLYVDALHRPIKYFICRCLPPSNKEEHVGNYRYDIMLVQSSFLKAPLSCSSINILIYLHWIFIDQIYPLGLRCISATYFSYQLLTIAQY